MKSEKELGKRLEYLKKWLEDNTEMKTKDYPLYREMEGRFWELADALEWRGDGGCI